MSRDRRDELLNLEATSQGQACLLLDFAEVRPGVSIITYRCTSAPMRVGAVGHLRQVQERVAVYIGDEGYPCFSGITRVWTEAVETAEEVRS